MFAHTSSFARDPFRIGDAHLHSFIDGGFGAGHNLLDVSIVHGFWIADDGHGRVIQHGVTLREQKKV